MSNGTDWETALQQTLHHMSLVEQDDAVRMPDREPANPRRGRTTRSGRIPSLAVALSSAAVVLALLAIAFVVTIGNHTISPSGARRTAADASFALADTSWSCISVQNGDGSNPLDCAGGSATLRFNNDGTVLLQVGSLSYAGDFSYNGDILSVDNVVTPANYETLPPGLSAVNQIYTSLASGQSASVSGTASTLVMTVGSRTLTYQAAVSNSSSPTSSYVAPSLQSSPAAPGSR